MNEAQYINAYVPNWQKPTLDLKGVESLGYVTPVTPFEYLRYAEADLNIGDVHGLVNGLSNAKRAIDCQVANILHGFGLSIPKQFPSRLEKISALGLVAPRIIKKIIRLRNLMEHEFHSPNLSEVEDAVDIVTLFLGATRHVFANGITTSFWVADEVSVNPTGIKRTKTKTIIDNEFPAYTFSRGIFCAFDLEIRQLSLLLVHENNEMGNITFSKSDKRTIPLLAFMSTLDAAGGKAYSPDGAHEFISIVHAP
ncbi:hypothetical protein [Oxalobacter paraformigenes]|nr:hypothetical protein [Oxalobacter paraformigenes]